MKRFDENGTEVWSSDTRRATQRCTPFLTKDFCSLTGCCAAAFGKLGAKVRKARAALNRRECCAGRKLTSTLTVLEVGPCCCLLTLFFYAPRLFFHP